MMMMMHRLVTIIHINQHGKRPTTGGHAAEADSIVTTNRTRKHLDVRGQARRLHKGQLLALEDLTRS